MKKILKTFDYKNLLIKEYDHWYLLLRDKQATLGSLVLIEKNFRTQYSDLSIESHKEFGFVTKDIEKGLKELFRYDKINYLMLMMVDPEVYYHVIPRYSKNTMFNKIKFVDHGWPGLPELSFINNIKIDLKLKLVDIISKKLN